MADTFCIMIQGLTFVKSPIINCFLIYLFKLYIFLKTKKGSEEKKNAVYITIYFFLGEHGNESCNLIGS